MHQSVATIDSPEFINLQPLDINPLMSKCEIKVFYLGENRNRSYIDKTVAYEMSKTLRGAPIVGAYRSEKEDFGDHGDKITIDQDGVKFEKTTKPYGFVAPDAKVWFQKFTDTDDMGNEVIREYLMTEGYLWTGQFEECQSVIDCGKSQSMELDEKTLNGAWSTNNNSGIDFFIINDAIFSKLCILGDDVEPCFEGASVTAPNVSSSFSKEDKFVNTLFSMMKELQDALNTVEGGKQEMFEVAEMGKVDETSSVQIEETVKDFEKKEDPEKKEDAPASEAPAEDKKADEEEDKDKKKVAENSLNDYKEDKTAPIRCFSQRDNWRVFN